LLTAGRRVYAEPQIGQLNARRSIYVEPRWGVNCIQKLPAQYLDTTLTAVVTVHIAKSMKCISYLGVFSIRYAAGNSMHHSRISIWLLLLKYMKAIYHSSFNICLVLVKYKKEELDSMKDDFCSSGKDNFTHLCYQHHARIFEHAIKNISYEICGHTCNLQAYHIYCIKINHYTSN
jgi:hypothetical protein